MDKVRVIERSMNSLRYSLWSLLPVFGMGFAVWIIIRCHRISRAARGEWNPARNYVRGARVVASVFFALWLAVTVGIVIGIILELRDRASYQPTPYRTYKRY